MPKLTREDLQLVQKYMSQYKEDEITDQYLAKLEFGLTALPKKAIGKDFKEVKDAVCKCIALYSLLAKANNNEVESILINQDMENLGFDKNQLSFIIQNSDKLDKFSYIDKDGDSLEGDIDEIDTSKKETIPVIDNKTQLHQEMIANIYSEHDNKFVGGKKCQDVIFDDEFFNNYFQSALIPLRKDKQNVITNYTDNIPNLPGLIEESAESSNKVAKKCNSKFVAIDIAMKRINNYLLAKNSIEEIKKMNANDLNIPDKTAMLINIHMNIAKFDLKKNYGLSDKAIDTIETFCNLKKVPEDFKILNKDGSTIDKTPNEKVAENNIDINIDKTPQLNCGYNMDEVNHQLNRYYKLKNNWDKKTIGDILKHPFKSISQYYNMNKTKNGIVNNYGLSEQEIQSFKQMGYDKCLSKKYGKVLSAEVEKESSKKQVEGLEDATNIEKTKNNDKTKENVVENNKKIENTLRKE